MKVQVKVNLKLENSSIIDAGTIYDDSKEPFPTHVVNNLDNIKIIKKLSVNAPVEAKPVKEAKEDKAVPKLIKKAK